MPAVVALGAVIIALLVLVLLYAGEYLGKAIAQLIPRLPLIGNSLRHAVESAANALGSWAGVVWDSTLQPAADFILAPIIAVTGIISDTVSTLGDLADTDVWLAGTFVPREIATATKAIEADITHLTNVVAADFRNAEQDITAGIRTAETWAAGKILQFSDTLASRIDHAEAALRADFATAEADITAGVHTAETWAAAKVAAAEASLTALIASALSTAEADITALAGREAADVQHLGRAISAAESAAIASAVGIIATDIEHAAGTAAATVTGAVDGAIDAAAGGFDDIVAGLRSIDWANVTDAAALATATAAIATTVSRYLERCGMPNCRNLSGLGRFLQDLLSDASLAALLAMLVAMIKDPEGAAGQTVSDLGGIAQSTIGLVTSLVGV